ncbi:MAG: ABC transporter permease subunit [Bdellovibrio sp.]|nr:ABC transporter permease subunit [Bdellovibrio sp.]
MTKISTIAYRDLKSYFTSPIAYIIIAVFLAVMGWMFFNILFYFNQESMRMQQYSPKGISLTDGVLRPLFGNMNVILIFLTPFITMRLFAEEKKLHTIELLLTSPVKLYEIVLGKFISSFLFVTLMLALTLTYPIILFATGNPDLGPIITCYTGTLLLSACYLSVGLVFTAMTENQIVAGALTFVALIFFFIINWVSHFAGNVWGEVFTYLSLIGHFQNLSQGIFNSVDILYYLSFIVVSLFLSHRVIDSYRWR